MARSRPRPAMKRSRSRGKRNRAARWRSSEARVASRRGERGGGLRRGGGGGVDRHGPDVDIGRGQGQSRWRGGPLHDRIRHIPCGAVGTEVREVKSVESVKWARENRAAARGTGTELVPGTAGPRWPAS